LAASRPRTMPSGASSAARGRRARHWPGESDSTRQTRSAPKSDSPTSTTLPPAGCPGNGPRRRAARLPRRRTGRRGSSAAAVRPA
jgi:hypothetical protein